MNSEHQTPPPSRPSLHHGEETLEHSQTYCPASQEWQWHNTLFTIAKLNSGVYIILELTRIDRSLVY